MGTADNTEKECFFISDEVNTEAVHCMICMSKSEELQLCVCVLYHEPDSSWFTIFVAFTLV